MVGNIEISDRNLVGNPIVLQLNSTDSKWVGYKIWKVSAPDVLMYQGVIYAALNNVARVDISNLFDKNVLEVLQYRVELMDDDEVLDSADFIVYPGAINKLFRRKLFALGSDIFSLKLKNSKSNFFLSTRTFNTEIFIPENELMPLPYYAKDMDLQVLADGVSLINVAGSSTEVIRYIDFAELRMQYAISAKKWVNVFKVVNGVSWSCSVIITEADATEFYLKFRNSLGALEKIALYQDANYVPTITNADQYLKYDSVIQELTKMNSRNTMSDAYGLYAKCENADGRLFLLDALLASETYLTVDGVDYAAKFTAEISVLTATNMTAEAIVIEAVINDDDAYYSPVVNDSLRVLTANNKELTIDNKNIVI